MRRHELLGRLHDLLRPRTYLEIGVSRGRSLTLSRTRSVGIDPFFSIQNEIRCDVHLVRDSSDEFFARPEPLEHFDEPLVDLAFLDGMHLAEYTLRDFTNLERYTHPASVVVFDDMLPRTHNEARRDRTGGSGKGAWAGDVYKVTDALREHRPDLVVIEIDTAPTGTMMVLNPDAGSQRLHEAYDEVVERVVTPDPQRVPDEVLKRSRASDPEALLAAPIWEGLRRLRGLEPEAARTQVASLLAGAGIATPR